MNPFMPDRSGGCDGIRHIPYPAQGDTLIASGGTPSATPPPDVTTTYGNDTMPIDWNDAHPPNIGATAALMGQGIGIDFMNAIPRVTDFPSGPGDDDNDPGWM